MATVNFFQSKGLKGVSILRSNQYQSRLSRHLSLKHNMLYEQLATLFQEHRIPAHMMDHGFQLLRTVINVQESSERRLVLEADTYHVINSDHRCNNMCYLLIKHLQTAPSSSNVSIQPTYNFTRLYGGQTNDFRQRERTRRSHTMYNSDIKLCLGHDLSQYQMDCLETTLIAFLLITYGMRTTNRTVYSKYIYRTILPNVDISDQRTHPSSEQGTNTYYLMRRSMIIGTSPPQTVLTSPAYIEVVSRWYDEINEGREAVHPLLDWNEAAIASQNVRSLTEQFQSDDDFLPPFINHHPGLASETYSDQLPNLTPTQLLAADRQVQASITLLRADVIVMLGARPTLLFAKEQGSHFFASVCPFVDLFWLNRNCCGFALWWPDHGIRRYTTIACKHVLEQIWRIMSHRLSLLLFRISEISPNGDGVNEEVAADVITWINDHPLSLQLQEMLLELTRMWHTPESRPSEERSSYNKIYEFATIRTYNMDRDLFSNLPKINEDLLMAISTSSTMPSTTLSEVIQDWSLVGTQRMMNKATRMIPNFHVLDDTDAGQRLQAVARYQITHLRKGWMEKYITAGIFVPLEDENPDQQFNRFFKMINMKRMLRGKHESAMEYTCCWCGQKAARVPQGRDKANFSTVKPGCPNGMAHSIGWEALIGSYDEIFPSLNIFLLFFESLPTGEVMNHWQLAAAFVVYLQENQWHVQAQVLYERKNRLFEDISNFRLREETAGPGATFIKALTLAMQKLRRINPPCNVIVETRPALPEEIRWSEGFREPKSLIGIRLLLREGVNQADALARLEDFRHMGYGEKLGIVRQYHDIEVQEP